MRSAHIKLADAQVGERVQIHPQRTAEVGSPFGGQTLQIAQQCGTQLLTAGIKCSKVIGIEKNPISVGKQGKIILSHDLPILHRPRQATGYLAGMQAGAKDPLKCALHQMLSQRFEVIQSIHGSIVPAAQFIHDLLALRKDLHKLTLLHLKDIDGWVLQIAAGVVTDVTKQRFEVETPNRANDGLAAEIPSLFDAFEQHVHRRIAVQTVGVGIAIFYVLIGLNPFATHSGRRAGPEGAHV